MRFRAVGRLRPASGPTLKPSHKGWRIEKKPMKIHKLITTSDALADLCSRLSKADFVCVDTEFMRESTYWPELCLIQIADANEAAAIDPKAPDLDLSPLLDLLVDNEDVLKIFHAGGQDVEIIYNLTGKTLTRFSTPRSR
jgi:ribonuclease D